MNADRSTFWTSYRGFGVILLCTLTATSALAWTLVTNEIIPLDHDEDF